MIKLSIQIAALLIAATALLAITQADLLKTQVYTGYTLTPSKTSIAPGETIGVTYTAPSTSRNRVGVFREGDSNDNPVIIRFVYQSRETIPFRILEEGTYEIRMFSDISTNLVAKAGPIYVRQADQATPPPSTPKPTTTAWPTFTPTPSPFHPTPPPAGGPTATFKPTPTPRTPSTPYTIFVTPSIAKIGDTVGIDYSGDTDSIAYPRILVYRYSSGAEAALAYVATPNDEAGSTQYVIPSSLTPGVYEVRYISYSSTTGQRIVHATAQLTILAVEPDGTESPAEPARPINPVEPTRPVPVPTIIARPTPSIAPTAIPQTFSLTATPAQIQQGEFITLTIQAPTGSNWVGVYRQGETNNRNYLDYGYYNNSTTTRYNTGKLTPGTYEFRLFQGRSYTEIARTRFVVTARTNATPVPSPRASFVSSNPNQLQVQLQWDASDPIICQDWTINGQPAGDRVKIRATNGIPITSCKK